MVELMLRRGLVVGRSCNPCGMLPRSFGAELFCWRDRAASGVKSRVVGKRVLQLRKCLFSGSGKLEEHGSQRPVRLTLFIFLGDDDI